MSRLPLVSVGLPTYNRPKQLEATLQYLINQDYKNIEIIVSDNHSENSSVIEILNRYSKADSRIQFVIQETNIEIEPNFNFVYNRAKGGYFMWVSDDDKFDNNYITECVSFLEANADYVLCSGISKYYSGDDFLFTETAINLKDKSVFHRLNHYFSSVNKNGVFYGVYRNNLGFEKPIQKHIGGDWNHVARVCMLGKVKTLDTIFVKRSDEGGSSSRAKIVSRWGYSGLKRIFLETYISYQVAQNLFNERVVREIFSAPLRILIQVFIFIKLNLKFLFHSLKNRIKIKSDFHEHR